MKITVASYEGLVCIDNNENPEKQISDIINLDQNMISTVSVNSYEFKPNDIWFKEDRSMITIKNCIGTKNKVFILYEYKNKQFKEHVVDFLYNHLSAEEFSNENSGMKC